MALLLYLASNEPDDVRARAPDRPILIVMFSFFFYPLLSCFFFGGVQRNSISPTEREKYRNARSPMAGNDLHGPDMKKIKREDKDGHVKILSNNLYIVFYY